MKIKVLSSELRADLKTNQILLAKTLIGELRWNTEVFSYDIPNAGRWTWNITLALELVAHRDRSEAVALPHDEMRNIAEKYYIDATKLELVDPAIPGIAARLAHPAMGRATHILVDGSHRCARALRDGLPFRAYLLSDEESAQCLLERP